MDAEDMTASYEHSEQKLPASSGKPTGVAAWHVSVPFLEGNEPTVYVARISCAVCCASGR